MPPILQVQCRVLLWSPIVLAAISWLIEQVSVFGDRKWVSMDWLLILKNRFTVVEFEQPDRLVRELFERSTQSYVLLNHIYTKSGLGSTLSGQVTEHLVALPEQWERLSCLPYAMNGWCHCTNIYWASLGTRHCAQCFIWIISFDLHSNPMK